ncbi:MAG TPA: hypothetical protein PK156_33120 [Polyangium sp.]|nr:hypothetical protein [Polyangium sp.]
MRTATIPLVTSFVLSALVPTLARAENPPTISALAEVRLPEMLHPKDSPTSLPATETIEGIQVTRNSHQHNFGTVEARDGRCVTLGAIAPGAIPSGNSSVTIRGSTSALPLRAERFVGADSGKPELEITDGWIDMNSNGMREERKTRVPLTVIGRGPAGYLVYGFRSDGKVHAIFPTPNRFVVVDAFGKLGFVACKHARLVLDPAASSGSLVRVAGTIEMRRSNPAGFVAKTRETAQPMTLRGIEATVSVSRTKRDKEALLSVTASWNEDEPLAPNFVGGMAPQEVEAVPVPEAIDSIHEE